MPESNMPESNMPESSPSEYFKDLPEEVKAQIAEMPKHQLEEMLIATARASEHMQNVVSPMLAFRYPKRSSISKVERRSDFQWDLFEFDTIILEDGEIKKTAQSARNFVETVGEDFSLDMIYVPGGVFTMGDAESESSEGPAHSVSLSPFCVGKFQVTQQQWKAIMHDNLSAQRGNGLPVENVSWLDANEFCTRLSLLTGRSYRLPSEAEWEYACRAGTTTRYNFGDDITTRVANYWDMDDPHHVIQSTPVGSFYPNGFGLYDMHGNVYELCQDSFHGGYVDAPTDGSAWTAQTYPESVVIRGGSCAYYADNCRSTHRAETMPDYRYSGTGFRVACSFV